MYGIAPITRLLIRRTGAANCRCGVVAIHLPQPELPSTRATLIMTPIRQLMNCSVKIFAALES